MVMWCCMAMRSTWPHPQDELQQNIIPQVALFDLLSKFDGTTEKASHHLDCACSFGCGVVCS